MDKVVGIIDLYGDEEEDEVLLTYLKFNRTRTSRITYPRCDLFNNFSDVQFVARYKIDQRTAMDLFNEIANAITPKTMRNNAIEPMTKLLLTLRYFATGAFMAVMADLGGVSTTSARAFIAQTIYAIAALRPKYVCFPKNLDSIKLKFYAIAKLPNVTMAIDCTHIRIISPGGNDAEVFRNRKGYFSINVQTVCDSELRIMDCVARWPGSTHDQRIFNNPRLMSRLENGEFVNGLVVGDIGYENRKYLITPLYKCRDRAENLYNEAVINKKPNREELWSFEKKDSLRCLLG